MNRCIVIGENKTKQVVIGCGLSENEAMQLASTQVDYDYCSAYINPVPFAVFKCKKQQAKKKTAKKTAKRKNK